MRKKIVAGNWKMNLHDSDVMSYVIDLNAISSKLDKDVEVIIFPSALYIDNLISLSSWDLKVGAQNCSQHNNGAFTGEISASQIREFDFDGKNLKYCLVGHSERRAYFNETSKMLAEKVNRLLENKLTPVFCCGEELDVRKNEKHFDWIETQITEGLFHLDESKIVKTVIAYEPVWAIGTGETATSDQAQEMHKFIRDILAKKYSQETADSISILYGGSCKPTNSVELFSKPDIDGGLIGGASLQVDSFGEIVNSFK